MEILLSPFVLMNVKIPFPLFVFVTELLKQLLYTMERLNLASSRTSFPLLVHSVVGKLTDSFEAIILSGKLCVISCEYGI